MELKEHYGAEVSRSVQCGCYTKRVSARTTRHSTELLYDLAKYRQGSCLVDHCTRTYNLAVAGFKPPNCMLKCVADIDDDGG